MTNKEKKALAYSLFVKSSYNRKQISNQVGCTEKTLRNWIKDGDWESIKEAQTLTRSKLLQDAYTQLKAINEKINNDFGGVPNKELSDAKGVIRKEIETLSDNPLHVYVEVFTEFVDWVGENHNVKSITVLELADEFVNHLATKEGI
mgnify:CR=1 FL=1